MDYAFHLIALIAIYLILAASVELLAGQTGVVSLAQAAFFGLGAYATAILTVHHGANAGLAACIGAAGAAAVGATLALPAARLRGDYLAVATFGFGVVFADLLSNWQGLTMGPQGIPGVPAPAVLGLRLESPAAFAAMNSGVALASYLLLWGVIWSPFGRVLRALREDEDLVRAFGRRPQSFRVQVFALAAALAAVAGSLYAHYVTYVSPGSFGPMESLLMVSMVIVGGPGRLLGAAIGSTTLVLLPEILRVAGLPAASAASLRQIVYGALLVVVVVLRPSGLVGRYRFGA